MLVHSVPQSEIQTQDPTEKKGISKWSLKESEKNMKYGWGRQCKILILFYKIIFETMRFAMLKRKSVNLFKYNFQNGKG